MKKLIGILFLLPTLGWADNTAIPFALTFVTAYPTSLVAVWQSTHPVNRFTVQVSTSPDFNPVYESLNTQVTTSVIPDLVNGTTYYGRVDSIVLSTASAWSVPAAGFTLNVPPPPLDRYGGFSTTADTTTGVHYKYWQEPDINAFEYRSIVDNIALIWQSTNPLSECDRYRATNLLLEERIDPYLTYPIGVFRSTTPFDDNTLKICAEGGTFYDLPPQEAENARLTGAWSVSQSSYASGGSYISASQKYGVDPASGTVRFTVTGTSSGTYYLWAKTWAPDTFHASFWVSLGTAPASVFTVSSSTIGVNPQAPWRWNRFSQTLDLTLGDRWLWFWAADPNVGLDKIILTPDPAFSP